jgi:hypothetical protein
VQWPIVDFMAECDDLLDTAGLIGQLDLIISVDTSVAHLAGALGKPVWVLIREEGAWQWMLEREDSPWYPTARVFRRPHGGDWHDLMARIASLFKSTFGASIDDKSAEPGNAAADTRKSIWTRLISRRAE